MKTRQSFIATLQINFDQPVQPLQGARLVRTLVTRIVDKSGAQVGQGEYTQGAVVSDDIDEGTLKYMNFVLADIGLKVERIESAPNQDAAN